MRKNMKAILKVALSFLFLMGVVVLVTGCSLAPNQANSQVDYAKHSNEFASLATELGGEGEYEFALDLARLLVEEKRYSRAEMLLYKLRKLNNQDARIYRLLSQVYESQNKIGLALVAMKELSKLPGKTLNDESELARLALSQEEYAFAEAIYQAWLSSDQLAQQVSGLNNLGFSALLQKNYSEAQNYFELALQKDALNAKALNNLKLVKTLVQ